MIQILLVFIFATFFSSPQDEFKTFIFYGDSLTAGYGLDPEFAFPNVIAQELEGKVAAFKVINAGISGETTAGGFARIDWVLNTKIDYFILELGANDGLRGLPLDQTRSNLQGIIDKTKEKYPDCQIILAGMMVPPNMGDDYANEFSKLYPELAKENDLPLIPFLLDGVAGDVDLNLADGIHPNVEGHKIVAQNVWKVLEPLL